MKPTHLAMNYEHHPPAHSLRFSCLLWRLIDPHYHHSTQDHETPMTAPADLQPSKRRPLISKSSASQEGGVVFPPDQPSCDPPDQHLLSPWPSPVLPIYVYNCSTATFCDLMLNLRINQTIPDLYNDFTFEVLRGI